MQNNTISISEIVQFLNILYNIKKISVNKISNGL